MAKAVGAIVQIGDIAEFDTGGNAREMPSAVQFDPALVADTLHSARVLLIGDGIAERDVVNLVAFAREIAPNVRILAVSSDLPMRSDALKADACYEMPRDTETLRVDIESALDAKRVSSESLHERFALIAGFGLIFALWSIVAALELLPPFLLPAPLDVARAFVADSSRFIADLATTAMEAFLGFLIGNVLGVLVAVAVYPSRRVQAISMPAITGLQALPIVALAPLLSLWFGTGLSSKVAMAAIVCFFPVIANLLAGFAAVDRDLADLFRFHRASYRMTLSKLLFPANAPALIAALRTSASLAVVGALVAEFTGADQGLGYQILTASYRLETDRLFVAILLSSLLGIVFAAAPARLGAIWLNRAGLSRSERVL